MRKPIDYDSELKALADKTKALKERRVRQLGELVAATGADALDADVLAGSLLAIVATNDRGKREEWRKSGEAFFRDGQGARRRTRAKPQGASSGSGRSQPGAAQAGAA